MDTSRTQDSVTNTMTVLMASQRSASVKMVWSLTLSQERGSPVTTTSMLTVVTGSISVSILIISYCFYSNDNVQSPPRDRVTCAPVWTVSTLTLTPPSATFSTRVLTARPRSTPAHPDSGSMSTAASATGPRPPTGLSARLRLMVGNTHQRRDV